MIIFDQRQKQSLFEFGIEIPVHDSRAVNTFKRLTSHPVLGPKINDWHIDIPIAPGNDDLYVRQLKLGLRKLDKQPLADIAIVVSGADPYEEDELPSADELKLSLDQMKERDLLVYNFLKETAIPRAYLMAGGYGEKSWKVYTQFLEWALLDHLF